MTSAWRLLPSTRFKRDVSGFRAEDPVVIRLLASAERILRHDPYNLSRRHDIKKLRDVPPGEGQ